MGRWHCLHQCNGDLHLGDPRSMEPLLYNLSYSVIKAALGRLWVLMRANGRSWLFISSTHEKPWAWHHGAMSTHECWWVLRASWHHDHDCSMVSSSWLFMAAHECSMVIRDTYGCSWLLMSAYEVYWVLMSAHDCSLAALMSAHCSMAPSSWLLMSAANEQSWALISTQ